MMSAMQDILGQWLTSLRHYFYMCLFLSSPERLPYSPQALLLTGFAYFPGVIYAHPGDTVRFINESGQEQTVVGKDADWVIGPLGDNEEASIKINAGMELLFFAAHDDDDDFGTYEQAPVRAEITFENPPLNG